jgi:hypothetical protein
VLAFRAGDGPSPPVADLVLLGAELAGRPVAEVARLADLLTADSGRTGALQGISSLSADGVPLQLCLTSGREGWELRLIGDPATHLSDPEARARASRTAIAAVLAAASAQGLADLVERSWELLLPQEGGLGVYLEGVTWFGASLGKPGCAVYFDVTKGELAERWRRVETWFGAIAGPAAIEATRGLRAVGLPMAAGLEGIDAERARLKLYWRLAHAAPLHTFGIPLLADPGIAEFLRLLISDRAIDGDGLVLAIGLSPADGSVVDVKADVCGHHCLGYSEIEWVRRLDAIASRFGFAPLPVARAFEHGARVSYVGFGVDAGGVARLNVYLGAPA